MLDQSRIVAVMDKHKINLLEKPINIKGNSLANKR